MRIDIENLWLFIALASSKIKQPAFILQLESSICLAAVVVFVWLVVTNLIYWSHPGGPAWGKLRLINPKPIPGPRGLPIIGSINLMLGLAHYKLAAMATACEAKRLMAFSLGHTRLIVTSHPYVAKEILNSPSFADRPLNDTAYNLMFNRAIGFAPYGVYWQTLRRIASTHLFSPKLIKASESQRYGIAQQVIASFITTAHKHHIRVRDAITQASLNNMMCCVFGLDYTSLGDDDSHFQLRKLVEEGYHLLGTLNLSDHLPWLAHLDLQHIRFRCSNLVPKVNRFVTRIIHQHRQDQTHHRQDFVDLLLSLQGSERLSESDMIAVLWEMIFRGSDTVAVLIEWFLARMVLHPDVQAKVQTELDQVVGSSRAVTESDVAQMVYLPAVVNEVLRLHPPGPLLSWSRLAISNTTVDGYHVPAGTTGMVNMWAIMRDPTVWVDPLEFNPERFVSPGRGGEHVDYISVFGSDTRLAPFGSGRRVCPGKNLGLTTVMFWVASLLHEFELEPTGEVDLSEVLRLSCEMANPLTVKVRPRRNASKSSPVVLASAENVIKS